MCESGWTVRFADCMGLFSHSVTRWTEKLSGIKVPCQPMRFKYCIVLALLSVVLITGAAHAQAPTVTSISPNFGPPGTAVTISGANFGSVQGSSTVTICGTAAISTWSDSTITAAVPDGLSNSCYVVVTVNSASSDCCSTIFDVSPPVITSPSIVAGPAGTTVTISGANFGLAQGTITFNGVQSTPIVWSSTTLVVNIPAGASSGNIIVTTSHGVAADPIPLIVSHPSSFYLTSAASTTPGLLQLRTWGFPIRSVSYTSSDLVNQPPGDYLIQAFDTVAGVPNTSDTWQSIFPAFFSIFMKQTAGTTGSLFPKVKLFLNGPSGTPVCTATGSTALTTAQTSYSLSCTPSANLTVSPSDRYYLWVGVNSIATPSSATQFQLTIGQGGGRGFGNAFISVPVAAHIPTITGSNSQYYNAGASFTITGTDFGATAGTVTFNGETAVVSSWSDTSITALVPNDAYGRSSNITVFSASNVQSNPWAVSVVAAINSLTPPSGAVGSSVIISGSGFGASSGSVFFNNTIGVVTSWSNTSITATVPAGTISGNTYVLPSDISAFLSNPFTFTVVPAPSISSLSPSSASIGAGVVISGANFGDNQGIVTFNGVPAVVSSWSDTSITATVPLSATSGNVVVTAVGGVSSAGVPFTVSGPVVSSIQPSAGVAGDTVVISGTDFGPQQNSSTLTFNGVSALVQSWSTAQIRAVVPSGVSTGPVVVTVNGVASNTDVVFALKPFITTVSPGLGATGSVVVIAGSNFGPSQGTSTISFNGVPATVSNWSDAQINAIVPSTTSGNVQVIVNGVGSNTPRFTVIGSAPLSPILQLQAEDSPIAVNLSDPINLDWITWGADGSTPAATRKAGTALISNFTALPGTPDIFGDTFGNLPFTWSGGTPIANSSDINTAGVASEVSTFDQNGGFQLSVPADTSVKTLKLYLRFFNSAQINLSLSDGSAPAISQAFTASGASSSVQKMYVVDFRAASAGQTLTVQLVSTDPNGAVSLQAATLQPHLPEVTLLSPQDGQQFVFPVTIPVGLEVAQFDSSIVSAQVTGTGNTLTPLQASPYIWSWQPGPGHYVVQGQALDSTGLTGLSNPVEVDVIGSGGTLSVSSTTATSGPVDLTSEGTADWILFTPRERWNTIPNPAGYSGYVHKGSVGQYISPATVIDSPIAYQCGASWSGFGTFFQVEDGTPDPSESGIECAAGTSSVVGSGFEFTVKADTFPRTLRLHAAILNGRGRLVAFLSDGSAPIVVDTSNQSNDITGVVYSITFSAASAGQMLTVRWLLDEAFDPDLGDIFLPGHVAIGAATLDGQPISLAPSIAGVQPNPVNPGQVISIAGNSFGGATGTVTVGGVSAQVISWADTGIQAVVPNDACAGPVVVATGTLSSNQAPLTINQPLTIVPQTAGLTVGQTLPLKAQAGGCNGTATGTTWSITSSSVPGIATLSSGDQPTLSAVGAGTVTVSVTVGSSSASATFTLIPQGPPITPPAPSPTTPPASTQNVTIVTDSLGHQTTYTSFLMGGVQQMSDSAGPGCSSCGVVGNYHHAFDDHGNVIAVTNARGAMSFSTFDQANNPVSISLPIDASTYATKGFTYNSLGEALALTDALGNSVSNTYDGNGNLLSVTQPAPDGNTAPSITQFIYDSKGELIQTIDPLGRITKMTYTSAGLLESVTDAQQNITRYEYDLRGNRTALIDPAQNRTTFTYDLRDRLLNVTYPDNTSVNFTYDVRGRRTSMTDQNGNTTSYSYDDADRLIATTEANGNVTQFGYDTESHRTSITDAMGRVTSYSYDVNGRLTQTIFPSGLAESYAYDAFGNITSRTDRKGQTITYAYDLANRLTHKGYPDSTAVDYTYDLAGKLTQIMDPTGSYSMAYDPMGRLSGTTTQYAFLPGKAFTNAYAYDAGSRRTSFTGPDGSTNSYQYDTLDHLTGLLDSVAGQFTSTYDSQNRRTALTRPNGVTTTYSYDTESRLLSLVHQSHGATIDGSNYTYDGTGHRTARTNLLNNLTEQYAYDPAYRLTQVTQGATTTESYSFDAVGNRLASQGIPSYSYNASNELTSTSTATYAYDSNGNMLTRTNSGGTAQFTWDFENHLASAVLQGSAGSATFVYDPFGRRIQKSIHQGGTTTATIYIYDGSNAVGELDQNGNWTARYVQEFGVDTHLAQVRAGVVTYYEQDALNSVTSLTDASGALLNTYVYDSFGNVASSTGNVSNPFQYTGRDYDPETGLGFYRARYYDSSIGRFINEDPIGFSGSGTDLYAYVGNSPVSLIDPFGLCPPNKDKSDDCRNKILNAVSSALGVPVDSIQYLHPTDMTGATGDTDPNRPGWRNGAFNFDFKIPGYQPPANLGDYCGRFKPLKGISGSLHVVYPQGGSCNPAGDPSAWDTSDGNFVLTAHIDSAYSSPSPDGWFTGLWHWLNDVLAKADHGC